MQYSDYSKWANNLSSYYRVIQKYLVYLRHTTSRIQLQSFFHMVRLLFNRKIVRGHQIKNPQQTSMGSMKSLETKSNDMAFEGVGVDPIDDDRRFFHITYNFRDISRKKLSDIYEDKSEK